MSLGTKLNGLAVTLESIHPRVVNALLAIQWWAGVQLTSKFCIAMKDMNQQLIDWCKDNTALLH